MRRSSSVLLGVLSLWLAGCQRAPEPVPPSPAGRPAPPRADFFLPPPDGRLTAAQLELYLKIRDRAVKRPDPALGAEPADVKAAHDLGANAEEYLWVKERIVEVEAVALAERLNADAVVILERTKADMRNRLEEATDDASRELLRDQMNKVEQELARTRREAREEEPENVKSNRKLLEPYRARLQALKDEMTRLAGPAPQTPAAKKGK